MSGWRPGAKAVAITKRMGIVVLILEGVKQEKSRNGTKPDRSYPKSRSTTTVCDLGRSEVFSGKVPVHNIVEESIDISGAFVLVIQIVGVLPYIHGQQGHLICR